MAGGEIRAVSGAQLAQFKANKSAPNLSNLYLDTSCATTEDLKLSKWNKAVISELVHVTKKIVSKTKDNRFGEQVINWKRLYRERFQKIYQEVIAFRPLPGETDEERGLRLSTRIWRRRKVSKFNNVRHVVSGPSIKCELGPSLLSRNITYVLKSQAVCWLSLGMFVMKS